MVTRLKKIHLTLFPYVVAVTYLIRCHSGGQLAVNFYVVLCIIHVWNFPMLLSVQETVYALAAACPALLRQTTITASASSLITIYNHLTTRQVENG